MLFRRPAAFVHQPVQRTTTIGHKPKKHWEDTMKHYISHIKQRPFILLQQTTFGLLALTLLFASAELQAQKKKKDKSYAIFSLEEPKLIKKAGKKKKVKKFPLPPGAQRTDNKNEEINDKIGELQVYYVDMDIVKVREFYKKTLGTEGTVEPGNPAVSAGGSMITVPLEKGFTNPMTNKEYPNLLLYGAKLSWNYNKDGSSGKTRIMVQVIKDKEALAQDLKRYQQWKQTHGAPQKIQKD